MTKQPLTSFPGYSLRRAAHAMTADLAGRLEKHNIRIVDATALILIAEQPGATSSSIGRALDIQRANMVPMLKRLEDAELIERSPIDGKSQGISITEPGQAKLKAILKSVRSFEAELLDRIPEEHRQHFVPALDALWR